MYLSKTHVSRYLNSLKNGILFLFVFLVLIFTDIEFLGQRILSIDVSSAQAAAGICSDEDRKLSEAFQRCDKASKDGRKACTNAVAIADNQVTKSVVEWKLLEERGSVLGQNELGTEGEKFADGFAKVAKFAKDTCSTALKRCSGYCGKTQLEDKYEGESDYNDYVNTPGLKVERDEWQAELKSKSERGSLSPQGFSCEALMKNIETDCNSFYTPLIKGAASMESEGLRAMVASRLVKDKTDGGGLLDLLKENWKPLAIGAGIGALGTALLTGGDDEKKGGGGGGKKKDDLDDIGTASEKSDGGSGGGVDKNSDPGPGGGVVVGDDPNGCNLSTGPTNNACLSAYLSYCWEKRLTGKGCKNFAENYCEAVTNDNTNETSDDSITLIPANSGAKTQFCSMYLARTSFCVGNANQNSAACRWMSSMSGACKVDQANSECKFKMAKGDFDKLCKFYPGDPLCDGVQNGFVTLGSPDGGVETSIASTVNNSPGQLSTGSFSSTGPNNVLTTTSTGVGTKGNSGTLNNTGGTGSSSSTSGRSNGTFGSVVMNSVAPPDIRGPLSPSLFNQNSSVINAQCKAGKLSGCGLNLLPDAAIEAAGGSGGVQ